MRILWILLSCYLQILPLLVLTSSAEISEELQRKYRETYLRVKTCLKNRTGKNVPPNFSWDALRFPEDAEEHYAKLLQKTKKFRTNILPHTYSGHADPWLENKFIDHFSSLPLSSFGGLIPLFIQWTDIHVHHFAPLNASRPDPMPDLPKDTFLSFHTEIMSMLRSTVLYVTVSQDDQGLFKLSELVPNLLSLSAGGYGNVALPLIKGTLPYNELHTLGKAFSPGDILPSTADGTKYLPNDSARWIYEIGFYGNMRSRTARPLVMQTFLGALERNHMKAFVHARPDWKSIIARTKFNLAPRGYGRTSFRLAEIIQIGRIPVYLYDDIPWIPYAGTNISIESFGYFAGPSDSDRVARRMRLDSQNGTELNRMLVNVRLARVHYTYEGVLAQLQMFFRNPFGPEDSGGQLRCTRLPPKPN